jgi:hypothetical protein
VKLFGFLRRRFAGDDQTTSPEAREAYEQGRQFAQAVGADIDFFADEILLHRRRNFIEVLAGRLEGIQPIDGITYTEQAQIELKVMIENWTEGLSDQCNEVWTALVAKWGEEPMSWSKDQVDVLIRAAVDRHAVQLTAEGIERAAEAIELNNPRSTGNA